MKTLLLLILAFLSPHPASQVAGVETVLPSPAYSRIGDYAYGLIKISDNNNLSLIPNYSASNSSQDIISQNKCAYAINGGFYGEDSRPLGLLTINGEQLNRRKHSDLFDGFLNIGNEVSINSEPKDTQTVLQTGPILVMNSQLQPLKISPDKSSRRMVAATENSNLFFITVFNPQAEVLGPYLADLPQIVSDISRKENLNIDTAINLDGGRASIFYSPSLKLSESDPVGSIFCVK